MQRMSSLDAGFFFAENDRTPLQFATVGVFEGEPPSYGDLVRLIMSKLPQVPKYRQRVRRVPFNLARPVWTDDQHFQVLYHVRHTAVPSPGGAEELRNLAGRILAQRLDLSRPLWEAWLVEGLEGGRWALLIKMHHCMADGVGSSELVERLFDHAAGESQAETETEAETETPAMDAGAGAISAIAHAWRRQGHGGRRHPPGGEDPGVCARPWHRHRLRGWPAAVRRAPSQARRAVAQRAYLPTSAVVMATSRSR